MSLLNYQIHGYKNGHQLLWQNIRLSRLDQDTVDRLSDISGPLKPGEIFEPYFTCYPLPSKEFFIIARTWQDRNQLRAGCVVTKSIFIPIVEWEINLNPVNFFNVLLNSSNEKNDPLIADFKEESKLIPIINSPSEELVEALFLEIRQPIVVFNCIEAENISIRLYSILWASMKNIFSICTFSLSPRNINDKPFDLQFAPEWVKAKFSDWTGRRIDLSISNKRTQRHRWTSDLTKWIFYSKSPSLLDPQNNKFIKFDENSGEGSLRLSLLWNELLEKVGSESSPMAILGLLDIINSQPSNVDDLYLKIQPYILNSIRIAKIKLDNKDAWKFFSALLVKHKTKSMDRQILFAIRDECCNLAENNPKSAISFLESFAPISKSTPLVLLAGMGDGLANYYSHINNLSEIRTLPSKQLLPLIAASKKFAKIFVEYLVDFEGDNYIKILEDLFLVINSAFVNKAKNNLSNFIFNAQHSSLLSLLLLDSNIQFYRRTLNLLAKNTKFSVREFDDILLVHTKRLLQYDFLKDLLITYDEVGKSDILLIQLLFLDPSLILWLCTSKNISLTRKNKILSALLANINPELINLLRSDASLATAVLEILESNVEVSRSAYSNVLVLENIPIDKAIIAIETLPPNSIKFINRQLITDFIIRAFDNIKEGLEDNLRGIIAQADQIDLDRVLDQIISEKNTPQSAVKNIRILLSVGQETTFRLALRAEDISTVLAKYLSDNVDKRLEDGWINLIKFTPQNHDMQHNVAAIVLDFSYSCLIYDPSNLIFTAFPLVYNTYLHGNSISRLLPFLFFSDWDKCRTLRNDLVHRYLSSEWSRFSLFNIAIETGILKEVIALLLDMKGGKKFIDQAFMEVNNSHSTEEAKAIKKIISNIK